MLENENGRCTGKGWAQKKDSLMEKMNTDKDNNPNEIDRDREGMGTWCAKKTSEDVSDRATEVASCAETDDNIAPGRLGQRKEHSREVDEGRLAASAVAAQWQP